MRRGTHPPAQAEHFAVFLGRAVKRTVEPVWDPERRAWVLEISNTRECTRTAPVCGPDCDAEEHDMAMQYVFTYGRNHYGMKVWSISHWELTRDGEPVDISGDLSAILKALSPQPSAPGAPGLAGDSRQAGPDQHLAAKRNTVIRV